MRDQGNSGKARSIAMESIQTGQDYHDLIERAIIDQGSENDEYLRDRLTSLVEKYIED